MILPVYVLSMADTDDCHNFLRIIDLVDDAILARPNAPRSALAFQLLASGRSWVFAQSQHFFSTASNTGDGIASSSVFALVATTTR